MHDCQSGGKAPRAYSEFRAKEVPFLILDPWQANCRQGLCLAQSNKSHAGVPATNSSQLPQRLTYEASLSAQAGKLRCCVIFCKSRRGLGTSAISSGSSHWMLIQPG